MKLEVSSLIAIAGICVSVLLGIFSKWWGPVAAHIGYPFGVHRSLEQLGEKVDELIALKRDVEYADPSPSSEECKHWLKRVSDLVQREVVMKTRLSEHGLNYLERCKIGVEAKDELKKAEALIVQSNTIKPKVKPSTTRKGGRLVPDVTSLISQGGDGLLPEELSVPDPLPGMEGAYNKVLNFIKDNRPVSTIMGVWGMGGVGKTTLMNLVHDSRPLYDDYFVEVVFVQPGKGCTEVADLQKAIAVTMGLDEIANEISQAGIIRKHLQDKNFLLLLDDLWKDFDLEVVGIPSLLPRGHVVQPHRRKVVLTTRSIDVCNSMECHTENTIQMKCLSKEHSWNLFTKIVGNTIFNHAEILRLAEEIAEECSGLPMALCQIGKTVSSLKDPREWRTTRDLLKESKLQLTGSNENLFRRLQESYDNMTDDMKERFLLCSIWPENENIPMKKLIRWWTGLGMLDRFPNNASDSGYTLINVLVRASMLEKGDNGLESTEHSHVKMHSMIRKMAIGIVNEHGNKNKWLPNSLYRSALREELWCTVEKAWVSPEDTSRWRQWSPEACFPELKMLVVQHLFSLQLIHQFFQNITFLELEGVTLFFSEKGKTPVSGSIHAHSESHKCTWETICQLTQLRHLNLSATALGFLPELLKKLSKLEYLYIRNNMYLQTIPRSLILALKSLRGLDLFGTGACYEVLQELESSTIYLKMLGFTVRTVEEVTKLAQLETVCTQALCMHHVQGKSDPDIISLKFLSKLRELRELAIVQCFDSQKVLEADGGHESDYYQQLLPHLEIFELNNLLSLEKVIWKNAGLSIRVVSICDCDKLKDVTWVHHLKYLEELTVSQCQGMEALIAVGESSQDIAMNQTSRVSFPRLQKLTLEDLPKLSTISQQSCRFEDLSCISVTRCNEMKGIHDQEYKKSIKIYCNLEWWTESKSVGTSNPYLIPTFFS